MTPDDLAAGVPVPGQLTVDDFLDPSTDRTPVTDQPAPDLVVLSLGAGVQSTTLALLAADGTLPRPDVAIFADTGWEPRAVYEHLDRLEAALPFPVLRVQKGNLRDDMLGEGRRFAAIPAFVRNPDGSDGIGRRQCTSEYKLVPIRRKVRELLGAAPPDYRTVPRGKVCEQWVGFSTDEVHRANRVKDSDGVQYLTVRYPLLELGMSRADCERWLRVRGWGSVAKSACIGCPFHGNRTWRAMRDSCGCGHDRREHYHLGDGLAVEWGACGVGLNSDQPRCGCPVFETEEWDDAVAFDRDLRAVSSRYADSLNGEAYLHRSLIPLDRAPIDRVTRGEWKAAQGDLFEYAADVAAGLDPDEDGDPDGCSPYGCRSGEPVTLDDP